MLRMKCDHQSTQLGNELLIDQGAIDSYLAPGLADLASNHDFVCLLVDQFLRLEPGYDLCIGLKSRLQISLILAGSDDGGIEAPPEHSIESVHQDGLACTGLASQDIEPRRPLDCGGLDQSKISNAYMF